MVVVVLEVVVGSSSSSSFMQFFCWVFLVSLFLHPGLGFWAVRSEERRVGKEC